MLPFKSHMIDEILVEYAGTNLPESMDLLWKITPFPHHDAMAKIAGKDLFDETDLKAFKKLGYAVCHNKLDEHGKKVYIHHNMRTFKEKKQ